MQDNNDLDLTGAIAVIGMACRLPGAETLEAFWHNLINGIESIRYSTDEELRTSGLPKEILADPNFISACGRLDGIEYFDAGFFDMTARIAEITSPQQRLLLEMSQLALDDAGYYADAYRGKIGIYTAIESSDYEYEHIRTNPLLYDRLGYKTIQFANDVPFSATQIAYKLNLTGPAVNITTACSSSLVAIHMACKCLLNYEADMMLAGGASYSVNQHKGYLYLEGGIGSKDGHCRAFDINASGTVSGNGAGMLVLKRLEEAIEENDSIYAIILSSAINNDGNNKVSYSAPGLKSQAEVISEALQLAGLHAGQISYVETHGTGTPLGDPIEVAALNEAFRETTLEKNYCALGALKSNIGHLACAAGVAGTIKTILSLQHKQLPPTLNITQSNPKLNLEQSPFYLNTQARQWVPIENRRIAGVSSFGMGGTNVHAIISEWHAEPPNTASDYQKVHYILPLSAKSRTALDQAIAVLSAYLETHEHVSLVHIAHTLQIGRKAFDYRAAIVAHNHTHAIHALKQIDAIQHNVIKSQYNVVLMFPGQGNQWPGMAKTLYEQNDYFKRIVDECNAYLKEKHEFNIQDILFSDDANSDLLLNQTRYTQISIFVIEYALARTLMHYGLKPSALIGHSIGEYVAATIAGVFSWQDAVSLVVYRAQLMQALPSGGMAAVQLSENELNKILPENINIAAINRPTQTVISGPESALTPFLKNLEQKNIRVYRLQTSHAFHSHMMDDCLENYRAYLDKLTLESPTIPYISNLTGTWIEAGQSRDSEYWVQHLRNPVRFFPGIEKLAEDPHAIFIEAGPGHSIKGIFDEHPQLKNRKVFNSMSSARNPRTDAAMFEQAIASIWCSGIKIDWSSHQHNSQLRRVHLPGYIFDRQRYWIERGSSTLADANIMPSIKMDARDWFYTPIWKQTPLLKPSKHQVEPGYWVVFGFDEDRLQELKLMLAKESISIIRVNYNSTYVKQSDDHYLLDADNDAHYLEFLQSVSSLNPCCFLYDARLSHNEKFEFSRLNQDTQTGFNRLLYIAKAINTASSNQTKLICLGSDLAPISGHENLNPVASMTAILCRTIQQEYHKIQCAYLDIVSDVWVENVIKEYKQKLPDGQVVYREQQRYVPDFSHIPSQQYDYRQNGLRIDGVYLITGGLNGIGYQIAYHLAARYQAKLVLISRKAPLYPENLELTVLSPHENNAQALDKIIKLQQLGAEVMSLPLDISDAQHFEQALSVVNAHFGPIHGIVHAAGIAGGGLLAVKTPEEFATTFAPKIHGTLNLITHFEKTSAKLDFIILCSSQNALKAGVARGDYSAANAFMDALAVKIAQKSDLPIMSVNWCAWKDTGMLHDLMQAQGRSLSKDKEDECLSIEEGMEVFEWLTSIPSHRLIVSKKSIAQVICEQDNHAHNNLKSPSTGLVKRPAHMSCPFVSAETELAKELEKIWRDVIGVDEIGIRDNFFELGGNSLLSVQIVMQVQQQYRVDINLRQFLECPTIEELENHIVKLKTTTQDFESLEKLLGDIENSLTETGNTTS